MRPGRIAVEEAFVTEDIAREWKVVLASKFVEPGFRMMGQTILGDHPGARMVHARLVDIGAGRIAQMDADGIDVAVLSITSPGVQAFDAVTATRLARDANDVLADAVRAYPARLAGLAAVTPQYAVGAAQELERAVQTLGMRGFIINSHTLGEYLDDQKYWPINGSRSIQRMPSASFGCGSWRDGQAQPLSDGPQYGCGRTMLDFLRLTR
jgi:2,3-dihydroxybenzoate decarboxylase